MLFLWSESDSCLYVVAYMYTGARHRELLDVPSMELETESSAVVAVQCARHLHTGEHNVRELGHADRLMYGALAYPLEHGFLHAEGL